MTTDDYIALITTEHANKPKFVATVDASVSLFSRMQSVLKGLPEAFDIDVATATQLDAVGAWIGRSRRLNAPIEGVYFTWDDLVEDGWDDGIWKGEFDPDAGIVELPDDSYRTLLKAKIAANSWDGSIPDAYLAWKTAFDESSILAIQDNQDMSIVVAIAGTPLGSVDKALLVGGYIPLKSEGVRIAYYAIVPEAGTLMTWDVDETEALAGWDIGQWAEELTP